jgi:hypothetical protein
MINIEEDQPFIELGLTKRKVRWIRERKGTSHHSSEIVLKENWLKMNPG